MPTFAIDVLCQYEETVEIEAESQQEALDLVEQNVDAYVVSNIGGYSVPWDNVEILNVGEF